MTLKKGNPFPFQDIILLLILVTGGFFALYAFTVGSGNQTNVGAGAFLDTVKIPFESFNLGSTEIPIYLDNYLIFQNFYSFAPKLTLTETYLFAGIVLVLVSIALTAFSYFEKFPFLGAGAGWIILLTVSNLNGMNIGGANTNIPLIITISGSLAPVLVFHIWKTQAQFWVRWMVILAALCSTTYLLVSFSSIEAPALYLAEHCTLIGLGLTLGWIFWQGHGVISGIYVLLARASQNLSTKISVQISLLAAIYFAILIFHLVELKGYSGLPFPTFPAWYLIIPIGVFGGISTFEKFHQSDRLAGPAFALKSLFFLGFAVTLWMVWKIDVSANQPAQELMKHVIVYTQISFTLFFMIYLLTNFLPVMNSGKSVYKILYKPYSLAYYHLRIGGLIGLLVILVYMDGIVSAQVSSLSTNILADYYYQSGQKLEASILYENSWFAYRKNPKAKNATAQLLFELNQPTLAKEHLEQSFAEAPQVDNILLLSERLNRENKIFEAIYYLENGLKTFPNHPQLTNNLAMYYVRTGQELKARTLLEFPVKEHPVTASNWMALQSKFDVEQPTLIESEDLISKINYLAAVRKSGNIPNPELINAISSQLSEPQTPMLLTAAWRNLVTQQSNQDPTREIKLLDSLASLPANLDYTMQMQESAILRSLASGRVGEAVINLNGLAFRNPGDAAYYLNLSAMILAQNLDFEKASNDILAAKGKGFKGFGPHHALILSLGKKNTEADSLMSQFPQSKIESIDPELSFFLDFNQKMPEDLFSDWKSIKDKKLKSTFARALLIKKSHGFKKNQIVEIGEFLIASEGENEGLRQFLANPDWANEEALKGLMNYLNLGDELTANPYHTPLILAAADRLTDPISQYELINTASDFNRDPYLWIRKVQAARMSNLDNYASQALQEMSNWLSWDQIEKLQYRIQ